MWRYGFTLWFALTTLLGPGVCYRSLSARLFAGAPQPSATTLVTQPAAGTARPDRREAAVGGNSAGEASKPAPAPAKCPPGVGKRANSLQPRTASDLAADLRLAAGSLPALPTATVLDAPPAGPLGSSDFSASTRLSGRDVLAAYCLLRC